MKKLLFILVFGCVSLFAQNAPDWPFTIAPGPNQLPAAAGNLGKILGVSDGAATNDCSTGGGSNFVVCISSGTGWLSITGGGGGGGGGSIGLYTNGVSNSTQTTLNLENSAPTNGLTLTITNVSGGNVQLGLTGTLSNSGLANSQMGFVVPSWLSVTSPVSLGGTTTISATGGQTSHKVIGTCNTATSFAPCSLVIGDLPTGYLYSNLSGAPTIEYQLIGNGGTSQTARNRLNLISGTNISLAFADNSGTNSTDVTITGSGSGSFTLPLSNSGSTGTTTNTLTKAVAGAAVIAATTDTNGVIGITTSGAGTSGTATIQVGGSVDCVFDGATTANDYVQISSTTAGNCHDAGINPPIGLQIIGRVWSTNGGGGTYIIDLFPASTAPWIAGAGFLCTSSAAGQTCTPDPAILATNANVQAGNITSIIVTGGTSYTISTNNGGACGTSTGWSAGIVTLCTGANTAEVGALVTVASVTPSGYDGVYTIVAQTSQTVSYLLVSNPGAYSSGGTALTASSAAHTGTMTPTLAAYTQNQELNFIISDVNSYGGDTVTIGSLGTIPIKKVSNGALIPIAINDLLVGVPYSLRAFGSPVTAFVVYPDTVIVPQVSYPISYTTQKRSVGLSLIAPTTITNTTTPTSIFGTFIGNQNIPAGAMLPYTAGIKTMHLHVDGLLNSGSSNYTATITIYLGGQVLNTLTVPMGQSPYSNVSYDLDYEFTVTGLTTASGHGCSISDPTLATRLCVDNNNITGLNFTTTQLFDVQFTWAFAESANSVTISQVSLYPTQVLN